MTKTSGLCDVSCCTLFVCNCLSFWSQFGYDIGFTSDVYREILIHHTNNALLCFVCFGNKSRVRVSVCSRTHRRTLPDRSGRTQRQGRSNGLKGGGTKFSARAFGARIDITRNFSAKTFSIVFARQS